MPQIFPGTPSVGGSIAKGHPPRRHAQGDTGDDAPSAVFTSSVVRLKMPGITVGIDKRNSYAEDDA